MRAWAVVGLASVAAVVLSGCSGAEPGADALAVGDCFNGVGLGDQVSSVPTVACSEPHEAEVFFVFEATSLDAYDLDAVTEAARETCIREFEVYVGVDYLKSELYFFSLAPAAETWEDGERSIPCAIATVDGTTVKGTLKDAYR